MSAVEWTLLRASLDELSETGFVPHHTALLGTLAEGLSGVGQVSQGLTVVDEALGSVGAR
jgi:hypothetical protein